MNDKNLYNIISSLLKNRKEGMTIEELKKTLNHTRNEIIDVLNKHKNGDVYCEISDGKLKYFYGGF